MVVTTWCWCREAVW